MFCPQTEEKHQSLVIHHENIVHEWVNSDYVHLMQIFSNLLSNAVKYTQKGGKIQFLVEECETKSSAYAKYHFAVIDNGVGMSEDFKDKIFDTFTREESSLTNKIQGTGLGMAITKNLIEAMEELLMSIVNWDWEVVLRSLWILKLQKSLFRQHCR